MKLSTLSRLMYESELRPVLWLYCTLRWVWARDCWWAKHFRCSLPRFLWRRWLIRMRCRWVAFNA